MLSQKALIVTVLISQWTARKKDKKATGTVEGVHATDRKIGQFTKKLLPGAKELEVISAQAQAIRKFFHEQTLPWMTDGSRIISNKNVMEFCNEFKKRKNNFELAIDAFLLEYPNLQAAAKAKLGDLFCDIEYPSEARLRTKFTCEMTLNPMPDASDFRVELPQSEIDAFVKERTSAVETAMQDVWQRLFNETKNIAEKLADPNAQLRESLFQNAASLTALLPKLNILDDANLEASRTEVEKLLSGISTDVMRDNASERSKAAAELAAVTEKMKQFTGIF